MRVGASLLHPMHFNTLASSAQDVLPRIWSSCSWWHNAHFSPHPSSFFSASQWLPFALYFAGSIPTWWQLLPFSRHIWNSQGPSSSKTNNVTSLISFAIFLWCGLAVFVTFTDCCPLLEPDRPQKTPGWWLTRTHRYELITKLFMQEKFYSQNMFCDFPYQVLACDEICKTHLRLEKC